MSRRHAGLEVAHAGDQMQQLQRRVECRSARIGERRRIGERDALDQIRPVVERVDQVAPRRCRTRSERSETRCACADRRASQHDLLRRFAQIVVRRHRRAVRAGLRDSSTSPSCVGGKAAVAAEHVAGFADRSDDLHESARRARRCARDSRSRDTHRIARDGSANSCPRRCRRSARRLCVLSCVTRATARRRRRRDSVPARPTTRTADRPLSLRRARVRARRDRAHLRRRATERRARRRY